MAFLIHAKAFVTPVISTAESWRNPSTCFTYVRTFTQVAVILLSWPLLKMALLLYTRSISTYILVCGLWFMRVSYRVLRSWVHWIIGWLYLACLCPRGTGVTCVLPTTTQPPPRQGSLRAFSTHIWKFAINVRQTPDDGRREVTTLNHSICAVSHSVSH